MEISPAKKFAGAVEIPADKSITHRAILLSALAEGTSTISNPLEAEDCLSTLNCLRVLGCRVHKFSEEWKIEGRGLFNFKAPGEPLNCGNSGTTMRLISGILAAQNFNSELIGDASLSRRPMDRVAKPLEAMGARIDLTNEKYPPVKIQGTSRLQGIHWKNPVASAQVKSAVLLAGLHARGETVFEEPTLSRDHSERMLKACGVPVQTEGTRVALSGPAKLVAQHWRIPGDFSSAAFFIVGALLVEGASVQLESVNVNPSRTGLLDVLQASGAAIEILEKISSGEPVAVLRVKGRARLQPFFIDKNLSARLIDEIPILAVAATQAEGVSVFEDLAELRFKETDRIRAMVKNLQLLGAKIEERPNGFVVQGPSVLHGTMVDSFGDHRIAMSMAIAGLIARGQTIIKDSDCVAISFPSFWAQLSRMTA